ncbi:hypothetical protein [Methylobacterium sp. WSM2598]|uniref:hypothetical protein n=1 Tax=Methylobacterium sp. WSM2598 TaxID=398261 RepID=UPI000562FE58|nr:hypothetical protein [Methylobacterium sp. WSM2598]
MDAGFPWVLVAAKLVTGAAGATLACYVLRLASRTLRVFGRRMNRTSGQAAYAAADALGVALAWPFEWAVDHADRFVAQGAEWRAQRRIWRSEFRRQMSWAEFRQQLSGQGTGTAVPDGLADALSLLGLTEPFTRDDLDIRFKRTMRAVHPDKGGSEYLARLVNEARALILERKGWKK